MPTKWTSKYPGASRRNDLALAVTVALGEFLYSAQMCSGVGSPASVQSNENCLNEHMPSFSSDWFSHNLPNWIKIFNDLKWDVAAPKIAIEIGSFEGRSTLWIAAKSLKNSASTLYCVDTFQAEIEGRSRDVAGLYDRFTSNVAASPGPR